MIAWQSNLWSASAHTAVLVDSSIKELLHMSAGLLVLVSTSQFVLKQGRTAWNALVVSGQTGSAGLVMLAPIQQTI